MINNDRLPDVFEETATSKSWKLGETSFRADGSEWIVTKETAEKPYVDRKGKEHYFVTFKRIKEGN